MTKRNLCLLTLLFTIATSVWALGEGAGSSGGGDNIADHEGAAWFLGENKTVRACFWLSPDFGVNEVTAKSEIETAFAAWRNYIAKKFQPAGIHLGITTNISVSSACKGDEDLTFFFGLENEEVRVARIKYENPTAFAFKRFYDDRKLWGQGWIWFAPRGSVFPTEGFPDWRPGLRTPGAPKEEPQPWVLRAMLMHEIGHVLGNSHVAGTIMSERISEYLRAGYRWNAERIDQARELAMCWQCPYEWQGSLGISGSIPYPGTTPNEAMQRMTKENFEILVGHAPKTDWISASVRADNFRSGTVLRVADRFEIYEFPITFGEDPVSAVNDTRIEDPSPIFKRVLGLNTGRPLLVANRVQGDVNYGFLKTKNGKPVVIIMERNLPVPEPQYISQQGDLYADYRLRMIYGGQIRPLFQASWLQLTIDTEDSKKNR